MLIKYTAFKLKGKGVKFIKVWGVNKKAILFRKAAVYNNGHRKASLHTLESIA